MMVSGDNLKYCYATDSWDKDIKRCLDILHDWQCQWDWRSVHHHVRVDEAMTYQPNEVTICTLFHVWTLLGKKTGFLPIACCSFSCTDLAQLTKGHEGKGLTLSTRWSVVHLPTLSALTWRYHLSRCPTCWWYLWKRQVLFTIYKLTFQIDSAVQTFCDDAGVDFCMFELEKW